MTYDQLKTFIQKTMRCDCPEDVLADISSEVHLSGGPLYNALLIAESDAAMHTDRIISVGGRLLVIITRTLDADVVRKIISAGIKVRDAKGYNRLRVVTIGPEHGHLSEDDLLSPYDERVHLHFLPGEK